VTHPLHSTGITPASSLLRGGPPLLRRIATFSLAVFAACTFSLSIAGEVLTFRTRAKLRSAPSTCRMSLDRSSDSPPSLSRKKGQPPVLTSSNQLSTLHQRFAYARLSQPCLPRSCPDFFCNAHHHRFWRRQLAVAREQHLTAVLEGPSFISRTVTQRRLDRRYS
jgi:hypothetical protein